MRRMYSEQELTKVIKAVFEAELESGALDESIADYVDAYLVEHPVDVTALEGQDVECASVTTTGDGFNGVNARPLYWHGIEATIPSGDLKFYITIVIINQSETQFTSWSDLIDTIFSWGASAVINASGYFYDSVDKQIDNVSVIYTGSGNMYIQGNTGNTSQIEQKTKAEWQAMESDVVIADHVNKLNG